MKNWIKNTGWKKYGKIITSCIIIFTSSFLQAQDQIPQTSGFSGYILVIPGVFVISNSLLASGAPLLDDVGSKQIASIFSDPESNLAAALPVAGELNYTFKNSKTQLFFGNKFEDIIRLDVAYGLGLRQDIGDAGILAANFLFTPLELKFWSDPYVEGEDRVKTQLNFPGFRIRWGRIFKTGFEITATARQYIHEDERSGEWLVNQGRLNFDQVPLLIRDGEFLRFKVLYKIKRKRHLFVPAFRYTIHNHEGEAVANDQLSFLLDYFYLSQKVILDAKVIYGKRKADAIHPVYNKILEGNRYGVALAALIPINLFKNKGWNILLSAEYVNEDANIDFFDSSLVGFNVGLMWRHTKKKVSTNE